jgi:hypothetical protein
MLEEVNEVYNEFVILPVATDTSIIHEKESVITDVANTESNNEITSNDIMTVEDKDINSDESRTRRHDLVHIYMYITIVIF